MNATEKKMVELLTRLREEYYLIGVKGEFEAEGAQIEELMRLKEVSVKAGVKMAVKIGGCEAITDMRTAGSVGADHIVAPMIESAFAAKKFISAAKNVFSESDLESKSLFINVETIMGAEHIQEIISLPEASDIEGLDIGRIDLSGSMNIPAEESNGGKVFGVCRNMCEKWMSVFPGSTCTLGGFLTVDTIDFLKRMSEYAAVGCESKKTVFSKEVIAENLLRDAYILAIDFEKLWYENCMDRYSRLSTKNWGYFEALDGYSAALKGQL